MLAKAIGEFSYEELLTPSPEGGGRYRLDLPDRVVYRFTASRGSYDSWFVDPLSITRAVGDSAEEEATDALRFVLTPIVGWECWATRPDICCVSCRRR